MDITAHLLNVVLVTLVVTALHLLNRARFTDLQRQISDLKEYVVGSENRLQNRMDRLENRLDHLTAAFAAMRSDFTHVALAVGARTRPDTA